MRDGELSYRLRKREEEKKTDDDSGKDKRSHRMLDFMKQKNLKPHDSTVTAISVGCSEIMELDLNRMAQSKSAYPYNKLLEACDPLVSKQHYLATPPIFGKMK
ncbi:hypothetical protein HanIR_Chr04g0204401 [Helianthus annuus]|nr:hypothetical protein HanIR_Chr04g0204401 [Helianthus annuus]